MTYPSGITSEELLKELGPEIAFQRTMIRAIHLKPAGTPQEHLDRLWDIHDRYATALTVAYEILTKVRITW